MLVNEILPFLPSIAVSFTCIAISSRRRNNIKVINKRYTMCCISEYQYLVPLFCQQSAEIMLYFFVSNQSTLFPILIVDFSTAVDSCNILAPHRCLSINLPHSDLSYPSLHVHYPATTFSAALVS